MIMKQITYLFKILPRNHIKKGPHFIPVTPCPLFKPLPPQTPREVTSFVNASFIVCYNSAKPNL